MPVTPIGNKEASEVDYLWPLHQELPRLLADRGRNEGGILILVRGLRHRGDNEQASENDEQFGMIGDTD